MTKSLLMFDTDHIKSYVFATEKLKEIRAASAMLDRLNRQDMPASVDSKKEPTVFANGGSGLFVVETGRVEAIKSAVKAAYRETTSLASITGVDIKMAGEEVDPDQDISTELKNLGYRLRAAKDCRADEQLLLTHSYLNFCSSCGVEYATETGQENNRPVLLCQSCAAKRSEDERIRGEIGQVIEAVSANGTFWKKDGIWPYLITRLHQQEYSIQGYRRPETFTELAGESSPAGYIGLIYADGDAMGQQVEQITSLRQYQEFADAVDDSIYQATVEAINDHLRATTEILPFDILMIGGDDLVMVTRANSVLEVGLAVLERFGQLTRSYSEKYGCKPLHLSVGVAIAHDNYPFGQLLKLGESGLKFAKKQAAKRRQRDPEWHEGLINFLVVSSANHLDFERYYKEQLQDKAEFTDKEKNLYRSLRPYTAQEFATLIQSVRWLKSLHTPRTRLEQLRTLLFQNKRQAMIDSLSLLFHWRSERQRGAIQDIVNRFSPGGAEHGLLFPWFEAGKSEAEPEYFTPLLDLVEIYDFIDNKEAANGVGD